MVKYIDRAGIEKLVNYLVDKPEYQGNLINPASAKLHILGVGDKALQFTEEALRNYYFLKEALNPEQMLIGGAGHDFGRPLEKSQDMHGLRSAKLIEEKGLEWGLADDDNEIFLIAQMARSHGFTYEEVEFVDKNFPEEIKKCEPPNRNLLIPETWQEFIVTAADIYDDGKGGWANPRERMEGVKKRYTHGSEYAKTAPSIVYAVEKGAPERVLKICDMIEKLREGKLAKEEIIIYSFL